MLRGVSFILWRQDRRKPYCSLQIQLIGPEITLHLAAVHGVDDDPEGLAARIIIGEIALAIAGNFHIICLRPRAKEPLFLQDDFGRVSALIPVENAKSIPFVEGQVKAEEV